MLKDGRKMCNTESGCKTNLSVGLGMLILLLLWLALWEIVVDCFTAELNAMSKLIHSWCKLTCTCKLSNKIIRLQTNTELGSWIYVLVRYSLLFSSEIILNNHSPQARWLLSNNPIDFISEIIRLYSSRLWRIIVNNNNNNNNNNNDNNNNNNNNNFIQRGKHNNLSQFSDLDDNPDWIGIQKCWFVGQERGKPEYPVKNLSGQSREPTTNSTHIWHWVRESNLGHNGGRWVLSPPCHLPAPH